MNSPFLHWPRAICCGGLLVLSLAAGTACSQTPSHAGVTYAEVGGTPLQLDVYAPTGAAPHPLVIWLHDGGWLTGDRVLPAFVAPLLQRGVAIASIDYRLTSEAGRYGSQGVTFPAQIHDVKAAIRYLRTNAATFDIDPARIGVWGSSAGGHLAALAGTSGNDASMEGSVGTQGAASSRVQAVVDYYGPVDLLQLNPDVATPPGSALNHDTPSAPGSLLIGFSGAGQGLGVLRANAENPVSPYPTYLGLARAANPISFVDADDPPFLIVHGTADVQVAIHQSERLRDALTSAGHEPRFIAVAGAGHGAFPTSVQQSAIDFLATTLTASPLKVGSPAGLAGAWYDPASSGQGFEVQWIQGNILLVFFFGHRNDGSNLFLIGVHVGAPRYGEDIEFDMGLTRGGRFTNFDAAAITREIWGSLRLRFDSCERGHAVLSGADGSQTMNLVRLARPAGSSCD